VEVLLRTGYGGGCAEKTESCAGRWVLPTGSKLTAADNGIVYKRIFCGRELLSLATCWLEYERNELCWSAEKGAGACMRVVGGQAICLSVAALDATEN